MKYLKCAACIVVVWFIFGSLRPDIDPAASRSPKPYESSGVEMDDSDVAIQSESESGDQDFIQKWTQNHPHNQEAQEESPIGASREDYFHVDQPDYFNKGQQKPGIEDHWGMDKGKSPGH